MLTITAQFGFVSRLSAVIAAVLSVRPLRLDHALTGWVCALGSSGHIDLRPDSTPHPIPLQGRQFRRTYGIVAFFFCATDVQMSRIGIDQLTRRGTHARDRQ